MPLKNGHHESDHTAKLLAPTDGTSTPRQRWHPCPIGARGWSRVRTTSVIELAVVMLGVRSFFQEGTRTLCRQKVVPRIMPCQCTHSDKSRPNLFFAHPLSVPVCTPWNSDLDLDPDLDQDPPPPFPFSATATYSSCSFISHSFLPSPSLSLPFLPHPLLLPLFLSSARFLTRLGRGWRDA